MIDTKTIIIIILSILLFIALLFCIFVMIKYVSPGIKKESGKSKKASEKIKSSAYNTEFYNKSVEHAQKVLAGNSFDPQYGESNFYANKLIDMIGKINAETKQSVITAIKFFSIEPAQARANEQMFRIMSEKEGVPLWFIILRESFMKVMPELFISNNTNQMQSDNKIIPLYQKTG